jgi:group I intron endonuclease
MIIEAKPGIYLISCLVNQKTYIGQTKSIKKRIAQHQNNLKKGNHPNQHLQNAYNKYGVDFFVFRPIEYLEDSTLEQLTEREQYWIDFFDSMNKEKGFNQKEAGLTGKHTEEAKQKMREVASGRLMSEEAKQKISEARKGKTLSEEHKQKIGKASTGNTYCKGCKRTEETKRKISEAMKAKNQTKGNI